MTDITRKRGDTYADEFVLSNATTRRPLDVTGYTFLLTVDRNKAPPDTTSRVFQIEGAILDAAAGRVEFAPTALQADNVGSFFYDMQMVDGAGRIRTVVSGKYKLGQDITK